VLGSDWNVHFERQDRQDFGKWSRALKLHLTLRLTLWSFLASAERQSSVFVVARQKLGLPFEKSGIVAR